MHSTSHSHAAVRYRAVCTLVIWTAGAERLGHASSRSLRTLEVIGEHIGGWRDASSYSAVQAAPSQQALTSAGIVPGSLDRSEPPFYAVLRDGDVVRLTRVEESFRTETTHAGV